MADKFTPEQRRAVTETEGNMLVSASAGSGKTYVMIERLIGIVLDGKAKVSEILAVTFTEAAAAEMKQKLVSALRKRLIDGGDNSAVRAALDEVPSASISTKSASIPLLKSPTKPPRAKFRTPPQTRRFRNFTTPATRTFCISCGFSVRAEATRNSKK